MPHFYTHVLYGTEFVEDVEGERFDDLEAACRAARNAARQMVSHAVSAGRNSVKLEFFVHDEAGARLAAILIGAHVAGLD